MLPFVNRWTKTSSTWLYQAQGTLIDMLSDQEREVNDLDYVLRDALRCPNDRAPNPERVFARVCVQITSKHNQVQRQWWSLARPIGDYAYLSTSYWYLSPLSRIAR